MKAIRGEKFVKEERMRGSYGESGEWRIKGEVKRRGKSHFSCVTSRNDSAPIHLYIEGSWGKMYGTISSASEIKQEKANEME